jgi:hypothetical protein
MADTRGCCEACAFDCHAGHSLKLAGTSPFFCDCGADNLCKRCTFDVTGKKYRTQPWSVIFVVWILGGVVLFMCALAGTFVKLADYSHLKAAVKRAWRRATLATASSY